MQENNIREEQAQFARRVERRTTIRVKSNKPKAPKLTGHEAYLKGLLDSGATVMVMTVGGDCYEGRLKHADKYTISLEVATGNFLPNGVEELSTYVFFKSGLEFFRPISAPPHLAEKIEAGLTD